MEYIIVDTNVIHSKKIFTRSLELIKFGSIAEAKRKGYRTKENFLWKNFIVNATKENKVKLTFKIVSKIDSGITITKKTIIVERKTSILMRKLIQSCLENKIHSDAVFK